MYNTVDRESFVPLPLVDTVESFTQELRAISDKLVQRSLSQYVAYNLKEREALDFLSNPDANKPLLEAEAKIRGVKVEKLAKQVQQKAEQMNSLVSAMELLRVEFASRYESAPNKLALRDELIAKARALESEL